MDINPYLQNVPALAVFGVALFAMMKRHERTISKILGQREQQQMENLVLRAEIASLRRLVLKSDDETQLSSVEKKSKSFAVKVS